MKIIPKNLKLFFSSFLIIAIPYLGLAAYLGMGLNRVEYLEIGIIACMEALIVVFSKDTRKTVELLVLDELVLLSLLFLSKTEERMYFYDYVVFSGSVLVLINSINLVLIHLDWCCSFSILLHTVVFLPIVCNWLYFSISGSLITCDTILAILQTNFKEVSEYVGMNFFTANVMLLVIFVILLLMSVRYLVCTRRGIKCVGGGDNVVGIAPSLVLVVVSIFLMGTHGENLLTKNWIEASRFLEVYSQFQKYSVERKQQLCSVKRSDKNIGGVYVLVIGESHNKEHMSSYGYERKTTPWLDSMRDNEHFIFLNNIFSCHAHTVQVLTYALTQKNQYNKIPLYRAITLIEACKKGGYNCTWLSNQVKYGGADSPITSIAVECKQQKWINNNVVSTKTSMYDEKLLDCLDDIKMKKDMLIVIHLMGNHGWYGDRYPKNFAKFNGKEESIDCYDNSILYNDYVVKNIFEKCQRIPSFAALVYVSDHAEDVVSGRGHDSSCFTPTMSHIPMWVMLSDSYIENNGEKYKMLRGRTNCYMTNDLLFNFMLSLMGIYVDTIYEPDNDFLRETYNGDKERFRTLYGKRKIL